MHAMLEQPGAPGGRRNNPARRTRRHVGWGVLGVLAGVLVLALLGASASGTVSLPWEALPRLLWGGTGADDALLRTVLWDIRLPRVLFSVLVGAALAATGVVMQALFRNPLAEPGLVGVSAGAAVGAVCAILAAASHFLIVALAAFAGGLLATLLAYAIGRRHGGSSGLLLAGIAINAVAGSVIGLCIFLANDTQLRDLTFWGMGSLASASWSLLAWLAPWTLLWLAYLYRQWRVLDALLLGEREAGHLGFAMVSVRRRLVAATALVVGPLVAVSGGIGFVGLVVPHLMRLVLGAQHRLLLPACMLAGALLLVLADWLARVVVSPAELPIGLVTSLVGGPFFFWLLWRGARSTP